MLLTVSHSQEDSLHSKGILQCIRDILQCIRDIF